MKSINLLGRSLFALMFFMPALNKILNFSQVQQMMASKGMPLTGFLLVGAIILLLLGSFSLATGFKSKIGAILLIIFLVPATLIFHTDFADPNQMIHFLKNLALIGGLLLIYVNGTGAFSLDNRKISTQ
ncbi:MAG: DoxX family protein [Bacteroidota bacterium]